MKTPKTYSAKFELIKRELEARIRNGLYRHGDPLPSEQKLSELFDVGRNTVRKAIACLEAEHLLVKRQGRVSRVNYRSAGRSARGKANRLAYFYNYLSCQINVNVIYQSLFEEIVKSAAEYGLAVDFFSTDSPNCWNVFNAHRWYYLGAFSVGLNDTNMSRGAYERLEAVENLIALDEVANVPARHLISVDNYQSGQLAAQHLLQCGCRKLAMFSFPEGNLPFDMRRNGFISVLPEEYKRKFKLIPISSYIDKPMDPALLDEVWNNVRSSDGIFCYCDFAAIHVLNALHFHNCRIPYEKSVIGFDGILIGQHTLPRLTSIAHPTQQIAEAAVRLALQLAENPKLDNQDIRIKSKLILGETTNILTHAKKR